MKLLLAFLFTAQVCLGSLSIPGVPASSGVFTSPTVSGTLSVTGSVNLFSGQSTITDGGDRTVFKGDTWEWKSIGARNGLYINLTTPHPQLTLTASDLWFETGDAGAAVGSISTLSQNADFGYSTYQQDDLPGFHPFRNMAYSGTMFYIPWSEHASYTAASSEPMQTAQIGTIAAGTQGMATTNLNSWTFHNAGNTRYWEMYLGGSSIFKTQTNVDFWINDAKFISYSSTAAKARTGEATLSSGTLTVTNTSMTAGDEIITSLKTPGGTLCLGTVKWSFTAATNFILTAVQADGSTCTTDTSTYAWWIINKQT